MGIAPHIAAAVVREHRFRPIAGDVLLLGRQTMQFSPEEAADMIRAEGLEARSFGGDMLDRRTAAAEGHHYIRDDAFFALLGDARVRALDHSGYEGAEILHDLNQPIPDSLAGTADFILDGSTLDNLFSPATGLQNMARMLRPGGRFLSVNCGTAHTRPYTMPTGYWFIDYCAINRFADCKVYLIVHDRRRSDVFVLDPLDRQGPAIATSYDLAIVAFGERGPDTTWDRMPAQRQYADAGVLNAYLERGQVFARSSRPDLLRSNRAATALTPSIVAWMQDYLRTRWIPAGQFDRIRSDGRRARSRVVGLAGGLHRSVIRRMATPRR